MIAKQAEDILARAQKVLSNEAQAVSTLAATLDKRFVQVVRAILKCRGQLIITGLGKSGLVARKIAATLTSTGTPSVFVHPVEALHGDLGIISKKDMLVAVSKSGNSAEMVKFVQGFRRLGGHTVAITENEESSLAKLCDFVLPLPRIPEADPLELAPTTSTTMTMALGDALAVTLLSLRGFTADDFAQFHPDGTLGRRLLLRAKDLMHAGEKLPKVRGDTGMRDVILEMTSKSLGLTCVVDKDDRFAGTITDGDLRRLIESTDNVFRLDAEQAIKLSRRGAGPIGPFTVLPEMLAIECREIMKQNKVTSLVILDDQSRPVGVVRIHEITAAGL